MPSVKKAAPRARKVARASTTDPTQASLAQASLAQTSLTQTNLTIDSEKTIQSLAESLREYLEASSFAGYIIGLTGGVDSAVAAAIAVNAVGKERVHAYCLPYKTSSHTAKDASLVASWLGLHLTEIDITSMIQAYYADPGGVNPVRAGNKMARERMSILFDQAFEKRLLVLGFINRTEIALGYFTWFGDSACSIDVLGQLYKTQVRQLAHDLGVPAAIQRKSPSADLWPGQQDEEELGLVYEEVDRFFALTVDRGVNSRACLHKAGFSDDFIERALELTNRFAFKRKCPGASSLGLCEIPDRIQLKK
ncbi:MAG: NAD+ synthase [Candidatus Zixiibacteriota bacterium]